MPYYDGFISVATVKDFEWLGCKEKDHEITVDFGIRGCLYVACGSMDLPSERGSALLIETPYSGAMPVLPQERIASGFFISSRP